MGTILPVSIIGLTDGAVPKVSWASPAATACADGAPPLKGTCVICTPASLVNWTPARCVITPLPEDE
ncbi:hypothetical protein D3C72_2231960 [compost metagenome]